MEQLEQAKQAALKFVSARMRTTQEVRQMLSKKGYPAQVAEQAVAFLKQYQYLDDRAYCRSWIHDKVQFHPCGRQKMAMDLAKKITDRQLIADSLADDFPRELELELAVAAAQKKLNSSHAAVSREQLSRFLYSRGYGGSIISYVLQLEEITEQLGRGQCNYDF